MKLTEKAAYIKGLADGLNYNKESAEGKLIAALIDMVETGVNVWSDSCVCAMVDKSIAAGEEK
jgi:hypothetical protein